MSDKIHLPDGSTHFVGQPMAQQRTAAERSAFLINQLEAQMAKLQTATKFLAAKLDHIKTIRDEYENAPEALGQGLLTFLEKLDDCLANKSSFE